MVAAKGMLSTKALATAETQIMIKTMRMALPPLITPIHSAMSSRMPVSSRPPTTMNRPIKKSRVL